MEKIRYKDIIEKVEEKLSQMEEVEANLFLDWFEIKFRTRLNNRDGLIIDNNESYVDPEDIWHMYHDRFYSVPETSGQAEEKKKLKTELVTEIDYVDFFIILDKERSRICGYLNKMTADFQNSARRSWGKELNRIDYDIDRFTEILLRKYQEGLFTDHIEEVSGKIIVFQKPKWDTKEGRGLYYVIGHPNFSSQEELGEEAKEW